MSATLGQAGPFRLSIGGQCLALLREYQRGQRKSNLSRRRKENGKKVAA